MLEQLVRPEIEEFLHRRDWDALRRAVEDWPPAEVEDFLVELDKNDRVLFFRSLPRRQAAAAFAHLAPGDRNELLADLADADTRALLEALPPDDRTALLSELPGQVTQRLLELLPPEELQKARSLLGYPEESVGRLMTPNYVAIHPDWPVGRALEHVRHRGKDSETVNRIYVIDEEGRLIDDLRLRWLILADPDALVSDVMDHTFVSVSAFEDQEEAARLTQRYDVVALPVVDSDGVLLGIVTFDDILDVLQEEVTEDFHKVGSVGPIQMSLREAPLGFLYRRRVGWLLVLVGMNIFSGAGIAYFEETIAAALALVFFLPLLIDSAGNAGSQAATLMVRALATGDVHMKDWFGLVGKEFGVALALGLTMAAAVSVLGVVRGGPDIAVVVSLTMVTVVVVGSLVGMSLPFILSKFRFDPATASAPLVTSIADISGVLIYFSFATAYLGVGS